MTRHSGGGGDDDDDGHVSYPIPTKMLSKKWAFIAFKYTFVLLYIFGVFEKK